jgi:hypothetical protein
MTDMGVPAATLLRHTTPPGCPEISMQQASAVLE